MLDFEGNLIEEKLCEPKHILDDKDDDFEMEDYGEPPAISAIIDQVCEQAPLEVGMNDDDIANHLNNIPELAAITSTLDPAVFTATLDDNIMQSKFGMSVGAQHGASDTTAKVTAAHQEKSRGITPSRLAKVFYIDEKIQ